MQKSLDAKLAAIAANPDSPEFILADAKDADMALGIAAPGRDPGASRHRTLPEYRAIIREIVRQNLVDIMLMSASTAEKLVLEERLFDNSPITPAIRANDTTDVWVARGNKYVKEAARPFRTANLDHVMAGRLDCNNIDRNLGVDLGLFSTTFNNTVETDYPALEAFSAFRLEAERKGFRYFWELFDPNLPGAVDPDLLPGFINDMIVRTLAGVHKSGRPVFLKMVYHGPAAMEELHAYDPEIVIGVLGGSSGTTYDAFKLLAEAKKYGAKAALFGRKINHSENQFAFIRFLRLLADGQISPEEAVRAYHGVLQNLGIQPHRTLEEDMVVQSGVMSYGGDASTVRSIPGLAPNGKPAVTSGTAAEKPHAHAEKKSCGGEADKCHCGCKESKPDFAKMTSAQRLAFDRQRISGLLGDHRTFVKH